MAKRWSTKPTGATQRIVDWLNRGHKKVGKTFTPPRAGFFASLFGCSAWTANRAVKRWRKAQKPRGYASKTLGSVPGSVTLKRVPQATTGTNNPAPYWIGGIERSAYDSAPITDHTDYAAMVSDIEKVADLIDAAAEKPLAVRTGCELLKGLVSRKQFSVTFDTKEWKIPTQKAED